MDTFLQKSEPTAVEFPPASGIFTAFLNHDDLLKTLILPEIQREINPNWVESSLKLDFCHCGFVDVNGPPNFLEERRSK